MLTAINPKLPMRDKAITRDFYINKLGFREFGNADNEGYLMVEKDNIEMVKPWHQKEFSLLDPDNNLLTFGQSI